jgi:formylglycine-generating enzyme required for sulfatase activity
VKRPAVLVLAAILLASPALVSCSESTGEDARKKGAVKSAGVRVPPAVGATVFVERGLFRNRKDGAVLELIPEGYYPLGRDDGSPAEVPAHEVFLDPYYIYRTEVTRDMYARYLGESGDEYGGKQLKQTGGKWQPRPGEVDLPITELNWEEARAYATWAGGTLPTEAQWEAAARGTSAGPHPWGAESPDGNRCNCRESGPGTLLPAGSLEGGRSPFGCLDMSGNAAEWCLDVFAEDAYAKRGSMERNPVHGGDSFSRVLRGGGYVSPARACSVTTRTGLDPGERLSWVGFRVVLLTKKDKD